MNRRDFFLKAGALSTAGLLEAQDTINVALIGVGNRGSAHLQNLLQMPDVRIVALCDINPKHLELALAKVAAAGKPRPNPYTDWKRMLERPEIRVVVSALPIHLHARNYIDAIAASKDLYAEKPLARTVAECDAVSKAAAMGDSVVMVGYQRRADPRVIRAVGEIHSGAIGKLIEGRIQWSNTYGPPGGWYGHQRESGDWMVEQACHNWDVMNWVNQCRPAVAVGLGRNDLFKDSPVWMDKVLDINGVQPDRDVTDYYSAVVQYDNGVLVNILHSWISPQGMFSGEFTRIVGTRGGVDFNSGTVAYRPEQKQRERIIPQGGEPGQSLNSLRDVGAMRAFLDSVRSRKTPPSNVKDAQEAALTSMLVREAVHSRRAVTMKELLAKG